jgi:hypothetical protein
MRILSKGIILILAIVVFLIALFPGLFFMGGMMTGGGY